MEQSASGKLWLPAITAQSRKPFAVNRKLDLDVDCDRGGARSGEKRAVWRSVAFQPSRLTTSQPERPWGRGISPRFCHELRFAESIEKQRLWEEN